MREVIWKKKQGKAPGIDQIDLTIVKKVYNPIIKGELLIIINTCLTFRIFPKEWKTGKLIIFSKGSDIDLNQYGSYRPTCLLSVLGKILESLMAIRLKTLIEPHVDGT